MTTIITKNGSGAPTAGQLSQGELAVDLTNKELYTKDSGGNVIKVGAQGGSTGTFTDLTATSSFTSPGIDDNANATAITLASNGKVTIDPAGSSQSTHELSVREASSPRITIDDTAGTATDVNAGLLLRYGTTNAGSMSFGGSADLNLVNNLNGSMTFSTNSAERMRIASTGKVGIGSTDPESLLTLQGNSPAITVNATNNDKPRIELARDASVNNWRIVNDAATFKYQYGDDSTSWEDVYQVSTGKNHRWNTDQMVLTQAGNVGIGNTAPGYQLQIAGTTGFAVDTEGLLGAANETTIGTTAGGESFGLRSSGSGYLKFSIGSSEAMRIDDDGRVLINQITPDEALSLEVMAPSGFSIGSGFHSESTQSTVSFKDSNTTADYKVRIGSEGDKLLMFAGGAEAARIDTNGNLLVGKTSAGLTVAGCRIQPTGDIRISKTGSTADTMIGFYKDGSGTSVGRIESTSTTTDYVTSSDERLKDNIVDAPAGNIDSIKVRSFDWKADGSHQEYGFIAQELETVAPYAVSKGETDEDTWGVDYSKLVPMLVKEIQDLKAEVAALKGA